LYDDRDVRELSEETIQEAANQLNVTDEGKKAELRDRLHNIAVTYWRVHRDSCLADNRMSLATPVCISLLCKHLCYTSIPRPSRGNVIVCNIPHVQNVQKVTRIVNIFSLNR
jgi:hypothetical protein